MNRRRNQEAHRVGALDIAEDMAFVRRFWRTQRVGWGVMVLLIAGALAGLFGGGPLSTATAGDETRLQVRYARFLRAYSATDLRFLVAPEPHAREVQLGIARSYLDTARIERVMPTPVRVDLGNELTSYTFAVADDTPTVTIEFRVRFDGPGIVQGVVRVPGRGERTFTQIVYP